VSSCFAFKHDEQVLFAVCCLQFAPPNVGDPAFVQAYNKLVNTRRYAGTSHGDGENNHLILNAHTQPIIIDRPEATCPQDALLLRTLS
jgi:hypothetical protein